MTIMALLLSLWHILSPREAWLRQRAWLRQLNTEDCMFGKPEWFVKKYAGWGIHPVTWQGWLYTLGWVGLISVPYVLLVLRQQVPEAVIWIFFSVGLIVWDASKIMTRLDSRNAADLPDEADADILEIVDKENPARLETEKFHMRID